tara:strand:- start:189 stop:323 length:135 start_codon:yes stop_codon:yes gene_type:complete
MIENNYKVYPREILKRKIEADNLLKKIERGLQIFLESPFSAKNN